MNKLLSKIATLSVGLVMAAGVGVALGQRGVQKAEAEAGGSASGNWVPITSASDIVADTDYLLGYVADDDKPYFSKSTSIGNSGSIQTTGTVSQAKTVRFVPVEGGYNIVINKDGTTRTYLGYNSGTNFTTNTSGGTGAKYVWAPTVHSSGTIYFTTNSGARFMGSQYKTASSAVKPYATSGISNYPLVTAYKAAPLATSISVKTAPTKTSYYAGETFDPTGLVITATYASGNVDVPYADNESKFTFSPDLDTALQTTDVSVSITYEEKSTTQAITVAAAPNITSVSATVKAATRYEGDKLDASDFEVTVSWDGGRADTHPTSDFTWTVNGVANGALAQGDNAVVVTYNEVSSSSINVSALAFVGFVKVTNPNQVQRGDKVVIAAKNSNIVMGQQHATGSYRVTEAALSMSEDKTRIPSANLEEDVAVLTVAYGTANGTYSFIDQNGKYLCVSNSAGNMTAVDTISEGCDFNIIVEDDLLRVRSNTRVDSEKAIEIRANLTANPARFAGYKTTTNGPQIDLFRMASTDAIESARSFASTYLKMSEYDGDNTYNEERCTANYSAAKTYYSNTFDAAGKNFFAFDSEFAAARTRFSNWATANGETYNPEAGTFVKSVLYTPELLTENNAGYVVIIAVITMSALAFGIFFLTYKRKHQ